MDDGRASPTEQPPPAEPAKPLASVYDLQEWRRRLRARGRRSRRETPRRGGPYYGDYFGYGYYGYYGGYSGGYYSRYYGGQRKGPDYAWRDPLGPEAYAAPRRAAAPGDKPATGGRGGARRRSVVTLLPAVRAQLLRRRRALALAVVACLMIGALLLGRSVLAREWGPVADPPGTSPVRLADAAENAADDPAAGDFFPHDGTERGPQ